MKINWKLRLKNKATLAALAACVVAFIYQAIGIVGIIPPVAESDVLSLIGIVINLLVAVGVVIDPTTDGVSDSERAMGYNEPRRDA